MITYKGTYGQIVPKMEDFIYSSIRIMTVGAVTVYRTDSLTSITEYMCYCLHVIHLLHRVKEVL